MFQRTIVRCIYMACALLVAASFQASGQNKPSDPAIIGTWIVSPPYVGSLGCSELLGRRIGISQLPAEISVVISANSIRHRFKKTEGVTVSGNTALKASQVKDADGTEYTVLDYSYKVNTTVTPHQIDFAWKGPEGQSITSRGIYKIEGDVLWFSIGVGTLRESAPGKLEVGDRPANFEPDPSTPGKSIIKAIRKKSSPSPTEMPSEA